MIKCKSCRTVFKEDLTLCSECGSDNLTEDILAKDITGCDNCPIEGEDCSGSIGIGSGGYHIEPPCTSWDDNEIIYAGMYDF